ncbi:MAG: PLP-dependent aminotransferase family protein, partial [Ardenticatenaceae bacterium]|nr:PLP-dependent aminotransferase family protein [Ardenticatenaceae bacterium]
ELRELAKAHKVGFQPGYAFSSQDGLRDYVRLCFAFYDEARIVDGIERLTAVFRQPL